MSNPTKIKKKKQSNMKKYLLIKYPKVTKNNLFGYLKRIFEIKKGMR